MTDVRKGMTKKQRVRQKRQLIQKKRQGVTKGEAKSEDPIDKLHDLTQNATSKQDYQITNTNETSRFSPITIYRPRRDPFDNSASPPQYS